MLNEKTCMCCTNSLAHRRPQTRTCSSYCRLKLHRMNKAKPISVKLVLSKIQFDLIKSQAGSMGVMVNHFMLDRVMKPTTNIGVTV